jgi:hypothetical protein
MRAESALGLRRQFKVGCGSTQAGTRQDARAATCRCCELSSMALRTVPRTGRSQSAASPSGQRRAAINRERSDPRDAEPREEQSHQGAWGGVSPVSIRTSRIAASAFLSSEKVRIRPRPSRIQSMSPDASRRPRDQGRPGFVEDAAAPVVSRFMGVQLNVSSSFHNWKDGPDPRQSQLPCAPKPLRRP